MEDEKVKPEIIIKKIISYPDGRFDAENAAHYLGLSLKTLAMMRCEGRGPVYVKRGRIFYFKGALDNWLREGETTQTHSKGV